MAAAPIFGSTHTTSPNWKIIPSPTRQQRLVMRGLVLLGLVALGVFLYWFIDADFIGYAPLYWALAVAFGYKLLRILHEWYHYVGISVKERPELTRNYSVDMLTTFCAGEPYDMVLDTLAAMVKVRYPHTTYLCDEANDPFLKQTCAELGVVHVYRGENKTNAKAGNINYALDNVATGEIAIILDPDHKPVPEFIDRVLPYFEQEKVGYVQCVQAYKNRNESFIAKGAAQQTYHFYGPMMMSMNSYGTVQAIGANCTFRRAALDSIGGHAPGLSEDMHTAMRLHAQGWQSVYVPESLTRGLVPATLSGYYKQQLKWSRGTFDLLFRVLPQLMPRLTWRQIIHYLTIPLFFLSGLIALIDIAVPILALTLAKSPWYVELGELVQYSLPLLIMIILIRQYAQHWTLEEHEGGFHFMGGALLFGSWWVTLTGFIYAIFNVKVPYIPTPKGDALNNEWRITRPNLIAMALSLAAIIYGLSIDWSPYAFIMAGYAGVNLFMLGFLTLVSQQKLLSGFYRKLYQDSESRLRRARRQLYFLRHRLLYRAMRNRWIATALILLSVIVSLNFIDRMPAVDLGKTGHASVKVQQSFLLGVALPASSAGSATLDSVSRITERSLLPVSMLQLPTVKHALRTQQEQLLSLFDAGYLPLLPYLPPGSEEGLAHLLAGESDSLLRAEARSLRALPQHLFLQLMPAQDLSDSLAQPYVQAWRHVVEVFRAEGVGNVVWVWPVPHHTDRKAFYPGARYVDYLNLDLSDSSESSLINFEAIYEPIRQEGYAHPVMLSGLTPPQDEPSNWLAQRLGEFPGRYPEIHGLAFRSLSSPLLADLLVDKTPPTAQMESLRTELARWLATESPRGPGAWFELGRSSRAIYPMSQSADHPGQPTGVSPKTLSRTEHGSYQWMVEGEPFTIQGVVYNPGQDWRDGHNPLTRNKLKQDFRRIKAMGGNTISRYRPSIYDENLIRAANDLDMKVMYGFWFEPWTDYSRDSVRVEAIVASVLSRVKEMHHHPSIIGWGLGSDTWERLADHFDPAYLPQVRIGYLHMLERIARQIHAQDSTRPVYTQLAAGDGLPAALHSLRLHAPSVDMPGIQVFYQPHAASLDSLMQARWHHAPYFVSEFGPAGHWDERYTALDEEGFLDEPTDFAKGYQLQQKWEAHIQPTLGHSLGGLAYCWQDRFDGTWTWYGLSDREGRLKPAYYALRRLWTQSTENAPLADAYLQSPLEIPDQRNVLNFRAISPNNLRDDLHYEWKLVKQHSIEEAGRVRFKRKYNLALVDLPLPPGGYRLYLSISDDEGNVVTASEGFPVYPVYNGD